MAHLYYLPPKEKPPRWPRAAGILAGFVVLYALGSMVGLIQP